MAHKLVNLAFPVVSQRIDHCLSTQPALANQPATASGDWRHRLEAYVLSRLPSRYVSLEADQACHLEASSQCYSSQQLQQIDALVEQGLQSLKHRRPQPPSQERSTPSSWFG